MWNATSCGLGGLDALTPFLVPLNVIIAILAIGGNLLVIIAVVKFSVLRKPATNHFVIALAIADLAVGLNIPFYVSFYFDVPYVCDPQICLGRYFIALWSTVTSMLLMIAVAFDRYVSIVQPLRYQSMMNHRVSLTVIFVIYLYVTILALLPFVWDASITDLSQMSECDLFEIFTPVYATMSVGCHVPITLLATTALYARIFREAWRQNRAAAALHQAHIRQEARTASMMVLILGASVGTLSPYLVVMMMRYAEGRVPDEEKLILSEAKKVVVILYFAKSALNPLIYGWKNRDFRVAFIRLLRTIPTLRSIKTLSGTRLQHQTSAVATLELASSDGHERNHVDIPISPLQEQPHVEGIVNDYSEFAC